MWSNHPDSKVKMRNHAKYHSISSLLCILEQSCKVSFHLLEVEI
jgi:hypothetical protein